jgi:hypothetical protein
MYAIRQENLIPKRLTEEEDLVIHRDNTWLCFARTEEYMLKGVPVTTLYTMLSVCSHL